MNKVELGKLTDCMAPRDAVHVAVAPVHCDDILLPGQSVRVVDAEAGLVEVCASSERDGIVDPFLTGPVFAGSWFYLCLPPNTVTSLQHHWEHPAFSAKPAESAAAKAHAVIEGAAQVCGMSFNDLMAALRAYEETGIYRPDNSEQYKEVSWDEWQEVWKAYDVLTGKDPNDRGEEGAPFSCSC